MTDNQMPAVATTDRQDNQMARMAGASTRGISFIQLWRREWQVKQQGAVQWLYPILSLMGCPKSQSLITCLRSAALT